MLIRRFTATFKLNNPNFKANCGITKHFQGGVYPKYQREAINQFFLDFWRYDNIALNQRYMSAIGESWLEEILERLHYR